MKHLFKTALILFVLVFSSFTTEIVEDPTSKDVAGNILSIKNASYNHIVLEIYYRQDYVGNISIAPNSTRRMDIGSALCGSYSYKKRGSQYKRSFIGCENTIY